MELRSDANPFSRREKRDAVARKEAAKKKGGKLNAARRAPRKKVATGKGSGKPPRR
jgi:hypothetical protein